MKKPIYPFWFTPNWFIVGFILCIPNGPNTPVWEFPLGIGLMASPVWEFFMGIYIYVRARRKKEL